MNFDGFTPNTIPRYGSYVASDDTTELPFGIGEEVLNCRYRSQSVTIRDGLGMRLTFGQGNPVSGFGVLRYLAADNSGQENIQIIAATRDGNVWGASPFTQSSRVQLTTAAMLAAAGLPAQPGIFAQACQAYNKMILARGDLRIGQAVPLIVDGATLTCDPVSDKPFGDSWIASTSYRAGQVVSPTIGGSSLYRCSVGGVTDIAEPVWPSIAGATVGDGGVTWQMLDIVCTSGLQPPAAPLVSATASGTIIPAGGTIFLVCTWSNQFGESTGNVVNPDGTIGSVLQWKNTTGAAVNLTVLLPFVTPDILALPAQYAVTTCNLYGYVVAGTPDPNFYLDPTSYAMIGSAAPGTTLTVAAIPTGQQIPSQNNAFTTDVGNVASGTRYMIVLYETRTGYICGFSGPAPIRCDITVDGRKMLVQNLPIGPYNCVARICAFTVAGQGSAGPYFYIAADDYVDPGLGAAKIKQTATKIPDNTTTSAYFDFLDDYLDGASDVTNYFDRIEVPACADVYFSRSLNRVVYGGGLAGFPSGFLVTDLEDEEAVRIPGSIIQVSETDGDRAVCWRDLGETYVAYKENSAHVVTPNDGDPSDWDVEQRWEGSGPCGPRAIDVASNDEGKMHVYAHRTGGYLYQGGPAPKLITEELIGTVDEPGLWDQINWAVSYLIRVSIDLKNRQVFFYVPLGAATANSHRITVSYKDGFDDPIIYIQRTGREVPNINGRKWSLDEIAATDCHYVPQRTGAS